VSQKFSRVFLGSALGCVRVRIFGVFLRIFCCSSLNSHVCLFSLFLMQGERNNVENNKSKSAAAATATQQPESRAFVTVTVPADVLLPSTRNCWVLVWGYTTPDQLERMQRFFASLGNVLDSRGCSTRTTFRQDCNWFALQYENDFLAKKAVCHSGTTLGSSSNSNIYCGVKHLNDDDPIVMQKANWTTTPSSKSPLWKASGENTGNSAAAAAAASAGEDVLDKDSILLSAADQRTGPPLLPPSIHEQRMQRSTCEQFVRWILLIHD
jgi:Nup53/35/40-type RNA recognition motif